MALGEQTLKFEILWSEYRSLSSSLHAALLPT